MQSDAIVMHDEEKGQGNAAGVGRHSGPENGAQLLSEPLVDIDLLTGLPPSTPLELDISGDTDLPVPIAASGDHCDCCALTTNKLWQGARAGLEEAHAVCTLCYLTGHLDSPTAAHGRLAYLPGLDTTDALHLQRRALLAILGGDEAQQAHGQRVWTWMDNHSREVEAAWGTARAGEFAQAMKRLPPYKRSQLQARLSGCVLMLPADMFDDLNLLLPSGNTVQAALSSQHWDAYIRSDLYV